MSRNRARPSLVHVIIAGVMLVWGASILFGFFVPSYEPPESLTLVTMAVVGPLVGTLLVRGKDDKSDETERETDR